ncbi:MAG TPA: hypothetical protein VME20_09225 [Acidimicrobiales bacterium]|nr:hypothetical protein [Acidimicrobiales bacterium]
MTSDSVQGPGRALPPVSALAKITVLLRHFDDELARLKNEASPGRLMSIAAEDPGVNAVLGALERALADAVHAFDLQPELMDPRQRLRGPLQILWADLVEMSPESLRKQWGAQEIPEIWPQLHQHLLLAIERAIGDLTGQGAPQPRR